MGIKNLNKFLLQKCSKNSIQKKHLSCFENKTLVIDASIYLYKFLSDGALIENMFLFVSILRKYNITPVFIFDGKPPIEKRKLILQRKQNKQDAERQYNDLKQSLTSDNKADLEKMESLKKQFLSISPFQINEVKQLLDLCGIKYFVSPTEADPLCVYFVKTNQAWACVSDDMDMFAYGCPRVLRGISLLNHTAQFYDTETILNDLHIPFPLFKAVLVVSGTDYNSSSIITTQKLCNDGSDFAPSQLFNRIKSTGLYIANDNKGSLVQKFTERAIDFSKTSPQVGDAVLCSVLSTVNPLGDPAIINATKLHICEVDKSETKQMQLYEKQYIKDFYIWLNNISNYSIDIENLIQIYNLFDVDSNKELHTFYNSTIKMEPIQTTKLVRFLYNYNFVFL